MTGASSSSNPVQSQVPCSELSCRAPLFILLIGAAVWLVLSSLFGFLATMTFHKPDIFADCAMFTYGRLRAVASGMLLYGFCLQAGIAAMLWLFVRIGRAPLTQGIVTSAGAALWNFGVLLGIIGIFSGDNTGFETLELPRYSALILFIAYIVLGLTAALTLRNRQPGTFYVSHWFLIAALFWFPWIYSTANLLLLTFPVRGVTQAVIAWWYENNLLFVWFSLVGLGVTFYFLPKLASRSLHNSYLAAVSFWFLILFGSWGGIPNRAPVPAWLPALSTVGTVLTVFVYLTVAMNSCRTVGCGIPNEVAEENRTPFRFIKFGLYAFFLAGAMNIVGSLLQVSSYTDFTWFIPARNGLQSYGFFAMTLFGAVYYFAPTLVAGKFWCPKLARVHFLLAAAGVILGLLPLAIGGVVQGSQLLNPNTPFMDIVKSTVMFIRISSIGDILVLTGNILFAINLISGVVRYYRTQVEVLYTAATTDVIAAGGRP